MYGHICPWGGSLLAACTKIAGKIANRLKRLPFAQVAQDGDDGVNVVFDVQHFDTIADIVKPRQRRTRVLSEEQRRNLIAAGRQFRLSTGLQASS